MVIKDIRRCPNRCVEYLFTISRMWMVISLSAWMTANDAQRISLPSGLPFSLKEILLPLIGPHSVSLSDFGGKGDGHTDNTEAFRRAIQSCADSGGGKVLVPRGIWLTGPIELKSNIDLHLETGALIRFSGRFEDYRLLARRYEGKASIRCISPLYGENLENIAITGEGIIDGSGQSWRPVKKFKMTSNQWKDLLASGGALTADGNNWYPSPEAMLGGELVRKLDAEKSDPQAYAGAREHLRPVMVGMVHCRRVLLDGPTFQNSPAWNIHPLFCDDVTIRNITVRNPWYSQNGDGLDLESCRRVIVDHCSFDVGDDAICIKSGKDEEGRKIGRPAELILIQNCTVYHGHGGFTIGSEMSGGARNILIRNCIFMGTDMGLRFKSLRGRGGIVENIYIEDIRMTDIPTDAIGFNMFYSNNDPSSESVSDAIDSIPIPVTEKTPRFRKIRLKNIVCQGAKRAVALQGLPEMPIQDIELENIDITADRGFVAMDARNIRLSEIKIRPKQGPVFLLRNTSDTVIAKTEIVSPVDIALQVEGKNSRQIRLLQTDLSRAKRPIALGEGVAGDVVLPSNQPK